jgi:hypothetical protein
MAPVMVGLFPSLTFEGKVVRLSREWCSAVGNCDKFYFTFEFEVRM